MGLDSVEILMRVENAFGIRIPDHEAEQIITVGDFHETVWRHLSKRHTDQCNSQMLYYRLRKSFSELLGFPPKNLQMDTSPEDVFPKEDRRLIYSSFAVETNLQLPDLVLTSPWDTILDVFSIGSILGGLVASFVLVGIFDFSNWFLVVPVVGIFLTIRLSKMLEPKRVLIPAFTIREFTHKVLALNYAAMMADKGTNRLEVESVINLIIAESAGLDLEEVTREKKIGDDLGID